MEIWFLMLIISSRFSITGNGTIAGTDNGYQADTVSLKSNETKMLERYGAGNNSIDRKKGKYYINCHQPGHSISRHNHSKQLIDRKKSTQSFPEINNEMNSKIIHLYSKTLHFYALPVHVPLAD